MYVHLHVHSYFSLLEGLASPAELAREARAAGMTALALTDHLYLTGAVEFYRACQSAGVKPILGLEVDVSTPAHGASRTATGVLTLLAADLTGWSNLCRMSSILLQESEGKESRLASLELLSRYADGLICLTGGRRGLPARLIQQGQEDRSASILTSLSAIFPKRLYIELPALAPGDATLASRLAESARHLNLPTLAAHDVFYLRPEEAALQRTAAAIRLNRSLAELDDQDVASPNSYFAACDEIASRCAAFPEALSSIDEIVDRCNVELPLERPNFPRLPLPQGMTPMDVLRRETEEGARRLYGEITPDLRKRLDYELEIIGERGFESIFLIMQEVIAFARRRGIPYSSRGSAASSLVAHCLGITLPDPLYHNLYFERFLNPARSTPPDIDTDLCSRRRDEVIQHIFERYGADRVAMVGTINRFRLRSALGDVAKAHGLPPEEIRRMVGRLPYRFFPGREAGDEGDIDQDSYAELRRIYPSERYQIVFDQAWALLGLPRHLSVHAGGVVITPGPMTELVPVMRSGNKGVTITQLDMTALSHLGLVKLDMLGIRGLTVMGDVAEAIYHARRTEFASAVEVLERIPHDDDGVGEMISQGNTIGCFQIESPGMRATLREIHARTVDDIVAALALYRPGPLKGGFKETFVRRHNGEEPVEYLHPALEPLLRDTYGVILYQEQVLRIAHELAGLSLVEADLLRRAMSHFDPGKQMQTLKERFIAGAEQVSGVHPAIAERVWEAMAAFVGYGFPRAHAASYAEVAWRSAWCKYHYPAQFMAAVLANWGGYYAQRNYLSEARRMGLRVKSPHVNFSQREFSVVYQDGDPVLYMGLDQVRDLTQRTIARILRERPFHTLSDLLARVDPRPKEIENLIRVGGLEGLGTIPALLRQVQARAWRPGQFSLFEEERAEDEDWSPEMKMNAQIEILGLPVDMHPLELVADRVKSSGAITTIDAISKRGERVRVAGVRQTWRRTRTTGGEIMAFLSLEDLTGILDVVVFPDAYRRAREAISTSDPIIVEGTIDMDETRGEPILRAERAWKV
jgi:DNA-directed DNA polymerase III PolC